MIDNLSTDDLILKRVQNELAPDLAAEIARLRAAKLRFSKIADERAKEVANLTVEIERLRAALVQIRGFVHVMSPDNWLDVRMYVERQCSVLNEVRKFKEAE